MVKKTKSVLDFRLPLMKSLHRIILLSLIAIVFGPRAVAETALDRYVREPDPAYHYELVKTDTSGDETTYIIKMISQSWLTAKEVQQTNWWHWLIIIRPKEVAHDTALLFIGGGSNRDDNLPEVD